MKILWYIGLIFLSVPKAHTQPQWQFTNRQLVEVLSDATAEESIPLLSADQTTLYFVRTGHIRNNGSQDIWYSLRTNNNSWGKPQPIKQPINTTDNEYIAGVVAEGLFLVRSMSLAGKQLNKVFITKKKGSDFSPPLPIDFPHYSSRSRFSGLFISANADKAIVSIQLNNNGNEDLYLVSRDNLGHWQEPVSLGDSINTTGFEISPFLLDDDRTLIFASNGRPDSEGTDIYYAKRKGNSWQQWTTPRKIKGVNSPAFDAYFSLDKTGKVAYWVSNHGRKNADIFTARLKHDFVEGQDTITDNQEMIAYDEIPEFLNEDIPTYNEFGDAHVYFKIASSELEAEMKKLLLMIASQLKRETEIKIRLQGYADDLGTEEYNLNLSAQRAQAVKNYLVRLGIDPDLFILEPMGEVDLKTDASEMQRELNRRVDIIINQ